MGEPQSRTRRAHSLGGALGVTVLGALLPGAGLLWARRWVVGGLVLLATASPVVWAAYHFTDLDAVLRFATDPTRLQVAAAAVGAGLVLWALTVVATYAVVRPRSLRRGARVLGATAVGLLCLVVAAPVAMGARYATVQADLVKEVFEDNRTATTPVDVTVADPWGGRDRVNVLLLGGDGSETRSGVRTDSMILVSSDTGTGRSVMFSLPRNMMNAQFPDGSPLHGLYPEGFGGYGDPAAWMLNAVYGQVPILHPGVLGHSGDEGADAIKQAVAGTLGVDVDYFVLVTLDGLEEIVDAIGGVTVNINEPVAIHGDQDAGVPPVDYLDPGPAQRLNGYEAMWFARGRYGSSDYARMERQRCLVDAIIEEADPFTLLRRYEALAAAGREILRTDIPAHLLPAFVDLSLRIKDADIRSIAFVASEDFWPADPDFEWLQDRVRRALAPPSPRAPTSSPVEPAVPAESPSATPTAGPTIGPTVPPEVETDPGDAVEVEDSCAYRPR